MAARRGAFGLRASFWMVLLVALALGRPAWAQLTDAELGSRVADAARHCPTLGIFDDITIFVNNRNVTVNGYVTDPAKREDVGRRITRVDGVHLVTNTIVVLPPLEADARLRQRVARAIYGNQAFWKYASSANPPIHIIVNRGHVLLVGAVGDETEKSFAYALSHVAGAISVTNGLRVDR